MEHFDVVVIGSGPGGYVAAIRAAQLGLKTACVEKDATLGGTCLNVGCIPSKALLESSERYVMARDDLAEHGFEVGEIKVDIAKMQARRETIVGQLTVGIDSLLKKNKIARLDGFGKILPAEGGVHVVEIAKADGSKERVQADAVVIATGSVPSSLPGLTIDNEDIIDSTGALELPAVPERFILIGAGVIGLELGSVWSRLGAKVTVLEYADRIMPGVDLEAAKMAQKALNQQGLEFVLGARVQGAEKVDGGVLVSWTDQDGNAHQLEGDKVLVAVGRKPFTEGLGLEEIGVALDERGRVAIDDDFQTNVPGIFAIGDVTRGAMLAHKASDEGIALAELLAGGYGFVNYDAIPSIVYTHPEVASVGKTEEELKAAKVPYVRGRFRYSANGRAMALGETDGMVKILAHKETDRILGCHIFGARAGDLIAEVGVAMSMGASAEDIARSCHAHPTLSEVIREAALDCSRSAIHK